MPVYKIIIFLVVTVLLIGGGFIYNKRLDEKIEKEAFLVEQRAKEAEQKVMERLVVKDVVVGKGAEAKDSDTVKVNYVGVLEDGTKFDSSYDKGEPFEFVLGAGTVIKGWELGLKGMRVGGKRELMIPPELAYGGRQVGPIPPNSTLKFAIELLEIKTK